MRFQLGTFWAHKTKPLVENTFFIDEQPFFFKE